MVFDLQRRQLSRYFNGTCTFWNTPLLNAILGLIELIIMSRLIAKFNGYYASRPLLTMMISNAVLGGMADTVAQSITSIRERALRKPGGPNRSEDPIAIEIHELDKVFSQTQGDLIPESEDLPPPFDFARLLRFVGYGFMIAPIQFKWFQLLSKMFPITKGNSLGPALKRVGFDQLIFAPSGLVVFFTTMTLAEGGGKDQVLRKLQDMYVPALKANYIVWPAVQILNFRVIPIQFQLPFVSTVGIAWTAYLSLTNASEDVRMTRSASAHGSPRIPSSPEDIQMNRLRSAHSSPGIFSSPEDVKMNRLAPAQSSSETPNSPVTPSSPKTGSSPRMQT